MDDGLPDAEHDGNVVSNRAQSSLRRHGVERPLARGLGDDHRAVFESTLPANIPAAFPDPTGRCWLPGQPSE
jgi:hypothetical protein